MTDHDKYAALSLAKCTMLPASYNKRFARALREIAESDEPRLTPRQRANLWRLVYRYRRQIPDPSLISEAQIIMSNPVDTEENVKERPISFTAPMILALLNTQPNVWPAEPIDPSRPFKWQTRRVIKPQPTSFDPELAPPGLFQDDRGNRPNLWRLNGKWQPCPYGIPGDLLWVQEAYQITAPGECDGEVAGFYLANGMPFEVALTEDEWAKWTARKYPYRATPGRFMYRSLSRLLLENKRVRATQLHAISRSDACAEGIGFPLYSQFELGSHCVGAFKDLWNSINADRGYPWENNSWVWTVDLMRVR
jgi:hypothetical protein